MKKTKPTTRQGMDIPQMPFDDALRKILSAPPQPLTRKKSKRALSKYIMWNTSTSPASESRTLNVRKGYLPSPC